MCDDFFTILCILNSTPQFTCEGLDNMNIMAVVNSLLGGEDVTASCFMQRLADCLHMRSVFDKTFFAVN